MHLSGYMSCPNTIIFVALHQTMQYLYHHPHLPIIYPSKNLKQGGNILVTHWSKGHAEYLSSSYGDGLVNFSNADHAHDLHDHCSVSALVHLMNGVAIAWRCKKQPETVLHLTGAEIRALYAGVMKMKILHQFSASIGLPIGEPTPTFEDNQGTIKCVKAACISDNAQCLDVKITWLAEQYDEGVVSLDYIMLANCETNYKIIILT